MKRCVVVSDGKLINFYLPEKQSSPSLVVDTLLSTRTIPLLDKNMKSFIVGMKKQLGGEFSKVDFSKKIASTLCSVVLVTCANFVCLWPLFKSTTYS